MGQKRYGDIAIIGMGCELPAGLSTPDALWAFLEEQRDAAVEIPKDRWSLAHFYDPVEQTPGKTSMRWGNFLDQASYHFEPLFFGISPREGTVMDFQQRLLLGVTWHMLEDASLVPSDLNGSRTGVFIGGFTQDHLVHCGSPFMRSQIRDQFAAVSAPMTMLAARIAHVYGFEGPTLAMDTACSSSLVALHQACNSLRLHECDLALAGGVNFMSSPQTAMLMTKGHFLAKDGRSKTFDASADGYGRGEGCVMLALKRLDDALRDGDDVRGVICGSGVNQDGRTPVMTMPDADAQEKLIRDVLTRADVSPQEVAYVEAHGTGTPVGDPIETKAISRAVAQYQPADRSLVVGAVKANLGHTEAVAGALGVLKAALCLQHRRVPAQANLTELNPAIPFDEYRLSIPQHQSVSLPEEGPLYAVVNSFGYGGTNAVALLRAPTEAERTSATRKVGPKNRLKGVRPAGFMKRIPLLVSAFSQKSLQAMAGRYADVLEDKPQIDWEALCFSAVRYRGRFLHRGLVLPRAGEDVREEALQALRALEAGQKHPALVAEDAVTDQPVSPAFVFSGMGTQWWGMGRFILNKAPAAVKALAKDCDALFAQKAGWSILGELRKPEKQSRIHDTRIAQPAIFLVQICLAQLFAQHGVRPGSVVGHSVGEVAAAYVSGALSLKDAIEVVYYRSQLQARLEDRGTMLAVGLSEDDLQAALTPYAETVSIAAVNAPKSCTLAGERAALEKLASAWEEEGVFVRFLKVDVPYHSPQMAEIEQDMLRALADLDDQAPTIPLYSTVTGKRWEEGARHDATYWYHNARQSVRFADVVRHMLEDEQTVFLELGSQPVLGAFIKQMAAESRHNVAIIPTLRRNKEVADTLTQALVRLSLAGAEPDWRYIMRPGRVDLPFYSWCVEDNLWLETEAARRDRLDLHVHPVLGTPSLLTNQPSWRADMTTVLMPWLPDHRIDGVTLFPAAGYIEAALAAHYQLESKEPAVLEDLSLDAPLVLQEGQAPVVMWSFDPASRELTFSSETVAWNGDWQQHGRVTVLQAAPWGQAAVHIPSLYKETTAFEGKAVYDEFAQHGLEYGPSFRTLTRLHRGEGFAVGEVALNDKEAQAADDYWLHPALLDGAMHTMIGAFPLEGDMGVFVPTQLRRLSYWGMKTSQLVVKVTPTLRTEAKVEADLRLYTPEGAPVAELLGLTCRRLARAGHDEASRVGRYLYSPSWVVTDQQMLMSEPMSVALLGEGSGLTPRLGAYLQESGIDVLAYPDTQLEALHPLLGDDKTLSGLRSVVWMLPADMSEDDVLPFIDTARQVVNAIAVRVREERLPFVVVTRGAYALDGHPPLVSPAQRAVAGFFRAVQSERTDLAIRCVDVPVDVPDTMMEELAAEIVLEETSEDTVALRPEERAVQRLMTPALNPEPDPVPFESLDGYGTDRLGVRLTPGSSGVLEGLTWQAYDVPEPGPHQVTLRTISASLNFKDVLKVMSVLPESVMEGTYNGHHLGMEAAAEIVAVGEGVTEYSVGDRVLAVYPDSFASHRVVDIGVNMVALNDEVAGYSPHVVAGAPLVFVTAYYCLITLAHLSHGESVLIHAGAGGVGQAAIQIAHYRGATVYATAGSPEKREFLRKQGCAGVWDSRTLEFVDGVREATNGRGVDVVLNSLPGEAMTHSLGLLARLGRFVEIGKRDIVEHRRLDLTPFNENLSFFSFDMDRLMPDPRLNDILDEILALARQHKLHFIDCTVYPAKEVSEAFRFLASSKHIGKVMLSFEDMSSLKVRPVKKPQPHVHSGASYLVTGGFGGLGLKTAEELVRQGAGAVHVLGRNLPKTVEAKEAFQQLSTTAQSMGCEVVPHQADVTHQAEMSALVSSLKEGPKPLRGVFHAAGVIDDVMLPNLEADAIARVLAPKVQGGHVLDEACRGVELDYFVLYSSFTTEIGNIGQSVYIAANSYLNALAERRRQRGEVALAVGWGAVGDVGMLTRHDAAARVFDTVGVTPMAARDALAFLPTLLKTGRSYVSVVDINLFKAFNALTWLEPLARFATVRQEIRKDGLSDTLQALFAMPEMERLGYVLVKLKEKLGSVLQIDPESISDNARLSELGIDSLAGVELQMAIRSEFGVDVSLVLLARNETIIDMSRSLLRQALQVKNGQAALPTTQDSSADEAR
ncbi:type I polyketide synthase [Saccharibacter floricola]|uniref:Polyketide synthase n=1 Tax=Saccharibacter floricola DSM 15669 TaxID=1123227 RepID=A0ABQ0NYC9_9PROT|nr:type I polyketide synthase [Saccharibacter floricola]GBQ06512.1 polyketide synthase [Saccharibacter floricola DSM 15669]